MCVQRLILDAARDNSHNDDGKSERAHRFTICACKHYTISSWTCKPFAICDLKNVWWARKIHNVHLEASDQKVWESLHHTFSCVFCNYVFVAALCISVC